MDGNLKIILALLWLIIRNFFVAKLRALQLKQERVPVSSLTAGGHAEFTCSSIDSLSVTCSSIAESTCSPTEHIKTDLFDSRALLDDLNARFGLNVNSLRRDFADGRQILHIIDALQPASGSVAKGNEFDSDLERLRFALSRAESHLGVRQIIDADDIRRENLEVRSMMIYLCQFLEKSLTNDECERIRRFVDRASVSLANNNSLADFKYEYVDLRPVYERVSERLGGDYQARWMELESAFKRDKEQLKSKLEQMHRSSMQLAPDAGRSDSELHPEASRSDVELHPDGGRSNSKPYLKAGRSNVVLHPEAGLSNVKPHPEASPSDEKAETGTGVGTVQGEPTKPIKQSNEVSTEMAVQSDDRTKLNSGLNSKLSSNLDSKSNSSLYSKSNSSLNSHLNSNLNPSLHTKPNSKLLQMRLISEQQHLESVLSKYPTTIWRLAVFISFPLCLIVLLPLLSNRVYFCRC